ncbi:MAG: heavy metal-binding domain-containing protein, partial [Chthoniobacterales bacterium]
PWIVPVLVVTGLVKRARIFRYLLVIALTLSLPASALLAAERQWPGPTPQINRTPAFAPAVEAWAMLFQMMGRLHSAVAKRELTLIDPEDPVASAAVSSILSDLGKSPTPERGLLRVQWIHYVRGISAMHAASDAGKADVAAALIKQVEKEFQELQKTADPNVLQAAHKLAERFTCPMHPDVIGNKGEPCPKCGMPLDQPVVLMPSFLAQGTGQHTVIATISTDGPLEPGKLAHAFLHLRRAMDHPVTLDQLIETHTKKIHLLIIDQSLTDYHHEHPQPTDTPGDYAFEFTPTKPGQYLAWADLRPLPLGLQEYDKTIIAGTGESEPLSDKKTRLVADSEGFHFELRLEKGEIKAGEVSTAKLTVTRDGKGFTQLEPVMAAFAHLVGFNEDEETVLHMHPAGPPILRESDRGGPVLEFKIYTTKPGFTRLFAQVQINGRQVFAPFGIQVAPSSRRPVGEASTTR